MRLFWKLFCSMVCITALACSLGGYALIDGHFRTSLEREVSAVYEENDLLRYALAQQVRFYPLMGAEQLADISSGISITTGRGSVSFRLSGLSGEELGGSGSLPVAPGPLTAALPEGQRGWRLVGLSNGRTYLHAASPLTLPDGTLLYLENCREVSDVFATREEQYSGFSLLLLALTAAVGVLSLAVTAVMLRPLARLSAATKRMAAGELDKRVKVDRDDELGRLSADFNAMADRLEDQMEELKQSARRQEDFIASFAHEIKTPLTSIIGYADLLRSRPATAAQVRDSAGYIFSEGRRLEALSHKLLELIVLEKRDFPLREVDMGAFLERLGGALRPALAERGIELTVRAQRAKLSLEPDLMETVCLNLLDNARKAMDGGGVILLEGLREDGGYCVRVTDNGKGIPREELARIAEPFYMVDKSRARAQGGAGLGLALCRRIVELHGGRMVFQSAEGTGTRVRVHLPSPAAEGRGGARS